MTRAARRPETATPVDKPDGRVPIGQAVRQTGISAKMIRHYEALGLLGDVRRTEAGYRQYDSRDIHTLRFIRRCRDLGFPIPDIAALLALWQDRERASAEVRRIARQHLASLEARIAALQAMKQPLAQLVACCHGDQRPDCPILDDLGSQ
ncbi:MAG: Cu(I)-responsive transcriptional regulator [Comamonas sp.]